jgi:hypothetical protein
MDGRRNQGRSPSSRGRRFPIGQHVPDCVAPAAAADHDGLANGRLHFIRAAHRTPSDRLVRHGWRGYIKGMAATLSSVAGTCVTADEATEVERGRPLPPVTALAKDAPGWNWCAGRSRVHRRMDWTPTGRRRHPGRCRGWDSGAAASVDRRCSESPGTHGVRRSRRTDKSPQSSHRMYRKWSVRETSRPATPKQLAQATWRRSRSVTASLWSKNVWWGAKTDYTPGRRSRQGAPGHEPCPRPPR